jgi:hypothetical protein
VFEVVLEDDDHRHVMAGSDCFKRVVKAACDGVRSGKGRGPMVFASTEMAQAYSRRLVDAQQAEAEMQHCRYIDSGPQAWDDTGREDFDEPM